MAGKPPFALEGLDHVVLLVDGIASAETFYREVIGCTVDRALPAYGMLQMRAGAALIDLVDIGSGGRNMDHVCIATGSWDEAEMRAHLAAHGVDIVEQGVRYGASGDGLSFYIRDPSGNTLELKRTKDSG